jgi:putative FmdB family regulatory protein
MPIYEYSCPQCNIQFELRLSLNEANCTPLCPKCQSEARRLISSFACKTGGSIQASEQPFRGRMIPQTKTAGEAIAVTETASVIITPPPHRIELLPPPGKRAARSRRKKK